MDGIRIPARAIASRPYRDEADWWRVRELLVATHRRPIHGWNWDVRRWDGQRCHRAQLASEGQLAATIALWETRDGNLVGAVHPEGDGDAFLELDPDFRSLEREMLDWAERHLAVPASGPKAAPNDGPASGPTRRQSRSRLNLWVSDEDEVRCSLLAGRGYTRSDSGGWMRCLTFDPDAIEPPALANPYLLRTTNDSDVDCARMADLLNAGFGRSVHTAAEIRNFVDGSPSFEHGLNLVAVARDGSFAATVGVTLDEANHHGLVEPVCTHPDHRRFGLARALLLEGLRRLQTRGAVTASLDTGEEVAANALYKGCGFTEAHHFHPWRREFRGQRPHGTVPGLG